MSEPQFQPYDIVLWLASDDQSRYRVIEFQPHNGIGGCYWIEDCETGIGGTAGEDELALHDRPNNPPLTPVQPIWYTLTKAQQDERVASAIAKERSHGEKSPGMKLLDLARENMEVLYCEIEFYKEKLKEIEEDHKKYLDWLQEKDPELYQKYDNMYVKWALIPK